MQLETALIIALTGSATIVGCFKIGSTILRALRDTAPARREDDEENQLTPVERARVYDTQANFTQLPQETPVVEATIDLIYPEGDERLSDEINRMIEDAVERKPNSVMKNLKAYKVEAVQVANEI